MKRKYLVLAIALAASAGCGDNSHECGAGTTLDEDGFCVAQECGVGTVLDATTKTCVVDPTVCVAANTVYIPGKGCVDATDGLAVDKAEGPEPNGFGIGEDSNLPAGMIVLKAVDQPYIIKGTINPFQDGNTDGEIDPDFDTYLLAVTAPTLIEVTVDGVNGLDGAFIAVTDGNNPAAGWRRFGINVNGDMSKRQLWLPSAGTYGIAIGDTRSMFVDGDSPPAAGFGGAAGGPNATYYATITVKKTPVPTTLPVANGTATSSGTLAVGDVKFFTVAMGLGYNDVLLDIPGTAAASVVLLKNNAFRIQADETSDFFGPIPAEVFLGGFDTPDVTLIVADTTYNYGPEATAYELTVRTGTSQPLSRTGGNVTQVGVSGNPQSFFDLASFYYDVTAADEIVGFNLAFNAPVDVTILDEDLIFASHMTWGANSPAGRTTSGYKGYIRHRHPGRYYVLPYVPGTAPSTVTATSTLMTTTPGTITFGTPLTAQAVNATFESNLYTYAAGTVEPWQQFDATGTATGITTIRYFNLSSNANTYGRLDDLAASSTPVADVVPVFTTTHAQAGAPKGRILIDDPTTTFLVTVNTQTVAGAMFNLDFKTKVHTDLGTLMAPGNVAVPPDAPLSPTAPVQFYLMKTTVNNRVTLLAHPDGLTDNLVIRSLNPDETTRTPFGTVNLTANGANETVTFTQAGTGWTAFAVSLFTPPVLATTFDLTVTGALPPYGISSTATVFSDACVGGTPVAMSNGDEGAALANTPTPAGFDYFGNAAPMIKIFSNGFATINLTTACTDIGFDCFYDNEDMPRSTTPNGVIAAYWDDLVVTVCTKTVGTKLIVQWLGTIFGLGIPVQFQMILDGANDSIEFVYGPGQEDDGISATIGLENAAGDDAVKNSFELANSVAPSSAKKFTPQ